MNRNRRDVCNALVAAAAALALATPVAAADEGPRVGELHPEIRLPTIDGERTIALSDLRGKRVLLIEFASW